jgi:hypothetical protein
VEQEAGRASPTATLAENLCPVRSYENMNGIALKPSPPKHGDRHYHVCRDGHKLVPPPRGQQPPYGGRQRVVCGPFHPQYGLAQTGMVAAQGYDRVKFQRHVWAKRAMVGVDTDCFRQLTAATPATVPNGRSQSRQASRAKQHVTLAIGQSATAIDAAWRKQQSATRLAEAANSVCKPASPGQHAAIISRTELKGQAQQVAIRLD